MFVESAALFRPQEPGFVIWSILAIKMTIVALESGISRSIIILAFHRDNTACLRKGDWPVKVKGW